MGIDLGTGGARAMAVSSDGRVAAVGQAKLQTSAAQPAGLHEQDPHDWWRAVQAAVSQAMQAMSDAGIRAQSLQAVCVDGTSGTLVCLDEGLEPTRPAMMYNDARASAEGGELSQRSGQAVNASFAIAKARWVQRHDAAAFARTRWLCHQADFVLWRLMGEPGVTDYSNALKTGYDLLTERWPDWVSRLDGVAPRLPRVVPPGVEVGHVCEAAAQLLGLPRGLPVISGASDGTAGFLASGARNIGDDNTTLGTTLVFKRIAASYVADPAGLIYCHKLPGGLWLPGAASNTGGEWMRTLHAGDDLAAMDRTAEKLLPTPSLAWPLVRTGERFPIQDESFKGFYDAEGDDRAAAYAARLQGTAMVERLCYEKLDAATGRATGDVYATGGGAASDILSQLRADVTGRVYHRPACAESVFGAAVLAGGAAWHGSPMQAVRNMVRIERTFHPEAARHARFNPLYEAFKRRITR